MTAMHEEKPTATEPTAHWLDKLVAWIVLWAGAAICYGAYDERLSPVLTGLIFAVGGVVVGAALIRLVDIYWYDDDRRSLDATELCDCGGRGWFLCEDAGHEDAALDGRPEVQRCDVCGKYPDDDTATLALFDYVDELEWQFTLPEKERKQPHELFRRTMTLEHDDDGRRIWR